MSFKIHVNKPLSSRLIIEMLDENPDLEEIKCPQSLYERTSDTYLDALNELGIKITPIDKRGRPKKYDDKIKQEINDMIEEGLNPGTISKRLHLNRKTIYYLKNKKLKQGPNSKYSNKTKQEIINMKNKGISVKKISEIFDIPVRTIYYILKKSKERTIT